MLNLTIDIQLVSQIILLGLAVFSLSGWLWAKLSGWPVQFSVERWSKYAVWFEIGFVVLVAAAGGFSRIL